MKKKLLLVFLCVNLGIAQTDTSVTYYKDKYRSTEVDQGPYKLVVSKVNDSITTHVFSKIKNEQKIWTETYLRDQPYGFWIRYNKKGKVISKRDYNFILKYGEFIPENAIKYKDLEIDKLLDPNYKKIQQHIAKTFRYPEIAQELGVQGRVETQLTIDEEGNVGNIAILKGVHKAMDTECFTILNSLKRLEPYEKDGKKVMVLITIPITFRLQ